MKESTVIVHSLKMEEVELSAHYNHFVGSNYLEPSFSDLCACILLPHISNSLIRKIYLLELA